MRRDLFHGIQFDRNRYAHTHTRAHSPIWTITICSMQIATGLISVYFLSWHDLFLARFFAAQSGRLHNAILDGRVLISCTVNACTSADRVCVWLWPRHAKTDSSDNYPGIYSSARLAFATQQVKMTPHEARNAQYNPNKLNKRKCEKLRPNRLTAQRFVFTLYVKWTEFNWISFSLARTLAAAPLQKKLTCL